eukprot:11168089-Lingulodinium_polyedra.AAC.1
MPRRPGEGQQAAVQPCSVVLRRPALQGEPVFVEPPERVSEGVAKMAQGARAVLGGFPTDQAARAVPVGA